MNMKKLFALLLALAMILALAACGGSTEASTAAGSTGSAETAEAQAAGGAILPGQDAPNTKATDENLVIGMGSEPSNLWGASCGGMENESEIINSAMMDRLVRVDRTTNEVVPSLATAWEWVDPTHCKFTLRDDVTMTDGTPLVADDVVYTVGVWAEYSANTDTGSYVVGAVADDEHTVTIEFNTAAPDLVAMLSWTNFGIASEDEVNAAGGIEAVGKNPVIGSGRYRFKEWKSGQSITLERNDNYWDKDYVGYFKTITFTFTQDAAAREMAVESGDAGVAYDLPVAQAATYVDKTNVKTVIYPFGQNLHLWYNMGEKAGPTKDIKVRQAIDLALDFDVLTQVATAGYGKSALSYIDESSKYYTQSYTPEERAQDLEKAKELLSEAGYPDGLELTILGHQELTPLYTVIQENLRQVGITLNMDMPDVPQFVQGANAGDYDLIAVGETLDFRYPTMMGFLRWANINTFWIGGPKWTSDEIESKIYAAIEEPDEGKAKEIIAEIEKLLKDEMIVTNICQEVKGSVIASDLYGFTIVERGYMDPTTFYRQ